MKSDFNVNKSLEKNLKKKKDPLGTCLGIAFRAVVCPKQENWSYHFIVIPHAQLKHPPLIYAHLISFVDRKNCVNVYFFFLF